MALWTRYAWCKVNGELRRFCKSCGTVVESKHESELACRKCGRRFTGGPPRPVGYDEPKKKREPAKRGTYEWIVEQRKNAAKRAEDWTAAAARATSLARKWLRRERILAARLDEPWPPPKREKKPKRKGRFVAFDETKGGGG